MFKPSKGKRKHVYLATCTRCGSLTANLKKVCTACLRGSLGIGLRFGALDGVGLPLKKLED